MRKRRQSNRTFILGFVLAIVVLAGAALVFTLSNPSVAVQPLPSSVPQYNPPWARYVPSTALLFGYENYTAAREYTPYPPFPTFLDMPDLKLKLSSSSMLGVLTIALRTPNASVDIAFLDEAAFSNFSSAFSAESFAAVNKSNVQVFYVRNYENSSTFQYGWLALAPSDRAVAISVIPPGNSPSFSVSSAAAQGGVVECMQVEKGLVPSILSRLDVRQMIFLANGPGGHISIGLQDFPGVVRDGTSTLTVVNATQSSVQVTRLIEFNGTQTAVNDWTEARSAYLNAHLFSVHGQFVEAIEVGSLTNIIGYIRLVE